MAKFLAWFSKSKIREPNLNAILGEALVHMKIPLIQNADMPLDAWGIYDLLQEGKIIPNFYGNAVRSSIYMIKALEYLGINCERPAQPHIAALLHDLGKLDNPNLYKKTRFTSEDMEARKQHPQDSKKRILRISQKLKVAANIASAHHVLGDNYPEGIQLTNEETFLAGLLGIIDCYDAVSTRPLLLAANPDKLSPREYLEGKFGNRVLSYQNNGQIIELSAGEFIAEMFKREIFGRVPAANPFSIGYMS